MSKKLRLIAYSAQHSFLIVEESIFQSFSFRVFPACQERAIVLQEYSKVCVLVVVKKSFRVHNERYMASCHSWCFKMDIVKAGYSVICL